MQLRYAMKTSRFLAALLGFIAAASAAARDIPAENSTDSASSTASETPTADYNLFTSETIVISASRTEEDLMDVPASVSVVCAESLRERGVTQVATAVEDELGIRLESDGTPGINLISIRGESPSRTVLLIDGERFDEQKTKSGAALLANPFFAERIEVIRGAASVLYGSDAQAGAVNLISLTPSTAPAAAEGGVVFNGSQEAFTEYLNASGTLGSFSYALGGVHSDAGDRYLSGHERLPHSSWYQDGLNAELRWKFSDHFLLGFRSEYFDLNARTATTTSDPSYKDFKASVPEWKRQKYAVFGEAQDLNEYLAEVKFSLYSQRSDKSFNEENGPAMYYIRTAVDNTQKTLGGSLQGTLTPTEALTLTGGFEMRRDTVDSSSTTDMSVLSSTLHGLAPSGVQMDTSGAFQQSAAFYLLLEQALTSSLTLSLGLRWNHVHSDPGSGSTTTYWSSAGSSGSATSVSSISSVCTVGSAALVFRPDEENSLRLNWSQGFRAPGLTQLFMTTYSVGLVYANPDLVPEKSDNFELGWRHQGPNGLNVDLTLFYTRTRDYIDKFAESIMTYRWQNIAKASSWGAELRFGLEQEFLCPYASLSLLKRKYEIDGESSTNTGTPKFFGTAGLRHNTTVLGAVCYADFSLDFATKAKDDNLGGSSYLSEDLDLSGYVTASLEGGGTFAAGGSKIHIFGGVYNLLDQSNRKNAYIHEPGRYVMAGIRAEF